MTNEIKEISKVDKKLLNKIEHILGSELSSKEYDVFYNYFNEIRKPNILIDIKDDENIKDYITNLQEEVKSANESITWWQNRFNALHKENERLKENISDSLAYDLAVARIKELEYIIDKAIEYIKGTLKNDIGALSMYDLELLKILQGEDNGKDN